MLTDKEVYLMRKIISILLVMALILGCGLAESVQFQHGNGCLLRTL